MSGKSNSSTRQPKKNFRSNSTSLPPNKKKNNKSQGQPTKGKGPNKQKASKDQNKNRSDPKFDKSVKNTEKDPIVNFGHVINSFLRADHLGQKKITMEYNHDKADDIESRFDKFTLTFSELNQFGSGYLPPKTISLKEFLSNKDSILKKAVQEPEWIVFCSKLLERLGITITDVPQTLLVKKVISFVKTTLSPIEKTILGLTANEWNRLKLELVREKVKENLVRVNRLFEPYSQATGPTVNHRATFIKRVITNTSTVALQWEEPNWLLLGFGSYGKKEFLSAFEFKNELDDKEAEAIESATSALKAKLAMAAGTSTASAAR